MTRALLVYVAGPYSPKMPKEWERTEAELEAPRFILKNVNTAIQIGLQVMDKGHVPLVPHLTYYMHMASPKPLPQQFWYNFDFMAMERCDAILRFAHSFGADKEYDRMQVLGKLCWDSIDQVPQVDE